MQNLKAEVTITIPKDMVLVNRVDYEDLKRQAEEVKTWSVADFKRELDIPKNVTWIKECLLKPNISEIKSWCTLKEGSGGRTGTVILSTGAKKWYKEFFPKIDWEEKIGQYEFTGIEGGFGENKKAMLVRDIAVIHGQPLKEINRRINDNRKRFKDGIDIIDFLSGSEPLRKFAEDNGFIGSNRTQHVYLLSERGYAKLLKILEDESD